VLKGRVERVRFSSPDTGFAVLKVKPSRGATFVAAGHVAEVVNSSGLDGVEFQFEGNWDRSKARRRTESSGTDCRFCNTPKVLEQSGSSRTDQELWDRLQAPEQVIIMLWDRSDVLGQTAGSGTGTDCRLWDWDRLEPLGQIKSPGAD